MKRKIISAFLVIVVVGLGAFFAVSLVTTPAADKRMTTPSQSSAATTPPTDGATALSGFLATLTNGVIFLQWVQQGTSINGSAQGAYLSNDGTQVQSQHESVSGTLDGSALNLSIEPDGLYGTTDLSGSTQGSGFVLSIPGSNGSLVPVQFSRATVADYDTAITSLQTGANQVAQRQQAAAAARQAAAAQQAAKQAAQQAAQNKIDEAACYQIGGTFSTYTFRAPGCHVPYIGTDGSTYDVDLAFPLSANGSILSMTVTASANACRTGVYPEANPGVDTPGQWNAQLGLCLVGGG